MTDLVSEAGCQAGRPAHAEPLTQAEPLTEAEVIRLRQDFPILFRQVRDRPLIYLDSAATAQRPTVVEDAVRTFDLEVNAAVHRGAHALAEAATDAFESARERLAGFFGAEPNELVVTSGSTAALNMAALSLGESGQIKPGDHLLITQAEHHANLVPWQRLAARTGAVLNWIEVLPDGQLDLDQLATKLTDRTKVVAFTHASNVTGAVSDVRRLVAAARSVGAISVLDAAQSAPHLPFSFAALGVDLAAISAHKMLGPTGVGALLGRAEVLATLPPAWTGGSMVELVTMTTATFQVPPQRFEAGTQPVAQLVGWAAAADYIDSWGRDRLAAREHRLTEHLLEGLKSVPGVRVLGPAIAGDLGQRVGAVSLEIVGVHPHDAGQYLDAQGIAVRVGHHCAQPVHRALGVHASTRASLGPYTSTAEIDQFLVALAEVRPYFGVA